jgi:hypothetical protein
LVAAQWQEQDVSPVALPPEGGIPVLHCKREKTLLSLPESQETETLLFPRKNEPRE